MRPRLSYANVVSTLAFVLALGGVSYAAVVLPAGSVGSRELKANAVMSAKVRDNSLLAKDFRSGQLPQGATGATGAVGPEGPQGVPGATGGIGPQGVPGATGGIGPQGVPGATGGIGPQGVPGATGGIGPQGVPGATGGIGPQGVPGPQGPAGQNGVSAIRYFATVKSDGSLVASTPGATSTKDPNFVGAYVIDFGEVDIDQCAASVNQGGVPTGPGGGTTPAVTGSGRVSIAADSAFQRGKVSVSTTTSAGAAADTSFHLIVAC